MEMTRIYHETLVVKFCLTLAIVSIATLQSTFNGEIADSPSPAQVNSHRDLYV